MSAIRLLAVADDAVTLRTIERVVVAEQGHLILALDVAEALATAASERPDVALVDVTLEGNAGLALVHHLRAVCEPLAVYALAPADDAELGAQALALGASGLLLAPPSGDALLRAIGEVQTRRAEAEERARLHREVQTAKLERERVERLVKLLSPGTRPDTASAARLVAETLAEATGARGAAVYAMRGSTQHDWTLLGACGSMENAEEGRQEGARRIVALTAGEQIVGHLVLEDARSEREPNTLVELAGAVVARCGESPPPPTPPKEGPEGVYSLAYFGDMASREVEKAKRHGRRLAIAVIRLDDGGASDPPNGIEDVLVAAIRESDVVARGEAGECLLLLPETGALGAHACRRRVLLRAEGDRRAKPSSSDRRDPVAPRPSRGIALSIGVATYPHDGASVERLVRRARRRARDASDSIVHALSLASMSLGEIIDTLLGHPVIDGGLGSPLPLDLALPAAYAVVTTACREAARGGGATVLMTAQPGVGFASAAAAGAYGAVDGAEAGAVKLHEVDVSSIEGCADADAVVVVAEHGTWTLCGRRDGARFRGVHSADPLVADLVAQRLARAGSVRLP